MEDATRFTSYFTFILAHNRLLSRDTIWNAALLSLRVATEFPVNFLGAVYSISKQALGALTESVPVATGVGVSTACRTVQQVLGG